jgi:D-alanyl-D-alanine dipeptidase
METDLEFYDVQKGLINVFSEVDLTNMNIKSKEFIREKIERSYLFDISRNQAADTVAIIKQLIESVGWELVAEDLALPTPKETKKLKSD